MKIIRLNKVNSTQSYLKEYIQKNGYNGPLCITSKIQTAGVGSRGNSWIGRDGNLFFSFVLSKDDLPKDLPLQSASIYFTYILKDVLAKKGSKIFLKWPNDFYIENGKIGGAITTTNKELLFCGIGLNLIEVDENFGKLDIKVDIDDVLNLYFVDIEKKFHGSKFLVFLR